MHADAEPARRPRRQLGLLDRPGGTRLRLAAHPWSRESVRRGVVGGMDGDQLALQVGRQLRDLETTLGQDAAHLIAVRLAVGRLLEVEQPSVPAGDLHALEAQLGRPSRDGPQAVERRRVAGELRQENGRPLDRLHRSSSLVSHAAPFRERLQRHLLLRREMFGDVDVHLDVLIPAPAVLLDPLPRNAELLPGWVPGGILSTTRRPSSVFTLILEPSSACARFTGTVQTMSSPSRRKNRSGSTCSTTTTSPFPFVPCPRRRSLVPSSVPAGTVITRRFSTRTSPLPPQVWHRSEGTRPLPRHTGHGRFTANPPCPNEITPRPRHSGHVDSVAPGAAPLPLQVGHTSAIGNVTGTLPPRAATRNGIVTVVSISSSSSARPPPSAPRRPKMLENTSPNPPNAPRSERSNSAPPEPWAPAPPPRPAPAYAP